MNRSQICLTIFLLILISLKADGALSESAAIHGFIAQGFLITDENNYLADTEDGSFEFNEMGINFSTRLDHNFRLGIQFFARDLGDLGNDEIIVDWAYADYMPREWFGIRAGKMKIPHGFYNESRDSDMMRTSILLPQGVYNEPWRDSLIGIKGVGIYGNLVDHISYQFQVGVLEAKTDGGMAKKFNDIFTSRIDSINADTGFTGNLQCFNLIDGLRFGGSIATWKWDMNFTLIPSKRFELPSVTDAYSDSEALIWAVSVEYVYDNFMFSYEYSISYIKTPMEIYLLDGLYTVNENLKVKMEAYYFNISYRFTEWFELGAYYSVYYFDKDDKNGIYFIEKYKWKGYYTWSKDSCLSLRFDINENWVLKLEGHYNDGFYNGFISDNLNDNGTYDLENYWYLFGIKIMYMF